LISEKIAVFAPMPRASVISATHVKPGDLLTTSGVDGVYPPGLPVARVESVARGESGFARIRCIPQGLVEGARHVMVLKSTSEQLPPRPAPEDSAPAPSKRGARK